MTIRAAAAGDHAAIAALLAEAFGRDDEARLVASLRRDGDAAIERVAVAPAGTLLGHVLFSPMRVGGQAALALAPLAVRPSAQGRGLGAALVRDGLAVAAGSGAGWCLVLGEPGYYARFGFRAVDAAGITGLPWSGHPAFQALALQPGVPRLDGPGRYACAFGLPSPEQGC